MADLGPWPELFYHICTSILNTIHMLYSLHIHIYMQRCSTNIRRWALSGCLSAPPHCWVVNSWSVNTQCRKLQIRVRLTALPVSNSPAFTKMICRRIGPSADFCNRKGLSELGPYTVYVLIRGWKAYFSNFLACELTYLGHIMHLCSNPFAICIVVWGSWRSKVWKAVSSKHMWHPSPISPFLR